MADQAEAGHVGRGMNVELEHRERGIRVELNHRADRGLVCFVGKLVALECGHENSGAERLAQHERIADPRADVAHYSARIDDASYCHPELYFLIGDSVASDDYDAGLARLLGGAAQNL